MTSQIAQLLVLLGDTMPDVHRFTKDRNRRASFKCRQMLKTALNNQKIVNDSMKADFEENEQLKKQEAKIQADIIKLEYEEKLFEALKKK